MKIFVYVLLLIFIVLHIAPDEHILISKNMNLSNFGKSTFYYFDTNNVSFDEIIKKNSEFIQSKETVPNFGFVNTTVWIRFTLSNPYDENIELNIEHEYPNVDKITLFYPVNSFNNNNEILYTNKSFGLFSGFKNREIRYRNIIFQINVPPQGNYDYYLKIESVSSINIPLSLRSTISLIEKINLEQIILGAFYGIMSVMFLYNFFLYLSLKDIDYLYYLFWIICATMVQFSLNGFSTEFFWNDYTRWSKNNLPFFMSMGGFWGLTFAQVFLSTKDSSKIIHIYLHTLKAICIIGIFLSLFFSYPIAIKYNTILWLIIPFSMLLISSFFVYKGYKPARFFLISWTTGFIGMGLFAAKSLNLLPSNFITTWGMQFGVGIEGVLLSIGLGDKINEIKREQIRAQEFLLNTKNAMVESFSRFVPKQFLTYLQKETIEDIELGDATSYKMTVLFSDIRNFTTLSETMTADENFKFLNSYLKRIEPIIQNHEGFVDKFIGDAIMALFPNNAQEALISSIEIQEELRNYNAERQNFGFSNLSIGIGLNSGELMLGTVGSDKRLDTTVIGDTVNLASRIEGLTKIYKVFIIITENTYNELSDLSIFDIREIDLVKVKGKNQRIKIFEVFNGDNRIVKLQKKETIELFTEGLNKYREGNFSECISIFNKCKKLAPGDTLPIIYIERCNYLLNYSPSNKWEGVSEIAIK